MYRRSDHTHWDLDEIEVERLMKGDKTIPLRRGNTLAPELVEAIRRLAGQGYTDPEVSQALNGRLSLAAVEKARQRYGIPAGVSWSRQVAA